MKFGIIRFPGSTGANELVKVLKDYYHYEVVNIWHTESILPNVDAIFVPAGNAFGDFPRSGALARCTNIMEKLADYAYNNGIIIGIGNGFQILCESGLLPGAFTENDHGRYVCYNTWIKADNNNTVLTIYATKDKALQIPVSHINGKYYVDKDILSIMRQNHQILFRYCDKNARISEKINPNGSLENIAGVCNLNKNIYGIMLRPERAIFADAESMDGNIIFKALFKALKMI